MPTFAIGRAGDPELKAPESSCLGSEPFGWTGFVCFRVACLAARSLAGRIDVKCEGESKLVLSCSVGSDIDLCVKIDCDEEPDLPLRRELSDS